MNYQINIYEKEIVEGCKSGDPFMQKALYDKYKDAMFTILYRMLNTEAEAADALQDSFIDIFRGLSNFQFKSSLGAWIKVIVIRKGIQHQKRRRTFEELSYEHDSYQLEPWDENLNGEYLEKGIMSLPAGYRNVFLLIEVEGFKHKEVAELLGISEGTSKSQLSKAKKLLQVKLKELMY